MARKSSAASPAPAKSSKSAAATAASPRKSGRRHGSNGPVIYEALRQAILDSQLHPGDRVTEVEIAERYGASRTPVREALKRLLTAGYLENIPGRGLVVTDPPLAEIIDVYFIREQIEGLAARFAAERATPMDLISLEAAFNEMTAKDVSIDDFIALSRVFSSLLFAAAHSPRLSQLIELARSAHVTAMRADLFDPQRQKAFIAERAVILDAVKRRDADAADAAMRKQVENSRTNRIRTLLARKQLTDRPA